MAEKTHYQKCREDKRCISCPKPAEKYARCDECRQRRKDAHAALAKAKKCVDCKNLHEETGVRCSSCKVEHVRLYNERKAMGVCPHDGKPSAGQPGTPCAECLITNRKKDRRKYAKLRTEVLQAYGGMHPACACCSEDTLQFLQVDHINNDGGKHRRELSGKNQGCNIYTWLRKNKYPAGFQILCANCNSAKGFYGICPHERARRAESVEPLDYISMREIAAADPSAVRIIADSRQVGRADPIARGIPMPSASAPESRDILIADLHDTLDDIIETDAHFASSDRNGALGRAKAYLRRFAGSQRA